MNTAAQNIREILFMPWAAGIEFGRGLQNDRRESIQIGPVVIQPLAELRNDPSISKEVAVHLKALFNRYVDVSGTPVHDVLVCVHGQTDFRQLNDDEMADVWFASNALVFTSNFTNATLKVSHSYGNSHRLPSELFALVGQRFVPGDESFAMRTWNSLNTFGSFREVSFQKPWCVSTPRNPLDTTVIDALSKLSSSEFSDQRARVARSLEYFRMANSGSSAILLPSRIVMITTALEALLGIPDATAFKLANKLNKRIPTGNMRVETRTHDDKDGDFHAMALWVYETLYKTRSALVHGKEVKNEQHWFDPPQGILQLDVANLVFGEILVRELNAQGIFGDKFTSQANKLKEFAPATDIARETENAFDRQFSFSNWHKALGWTDEIESQ